MMTRQVRRKSKPEGMQGRRTYWALVSLVGLFTVLGLVHTWTRLAVLDRNYAVGRAQLENDRLHRQLKGLQLEVVTLQRTARVDTEAEQKLGMLRPGLDRRIVLETKPQTASVDLPAP